MNTRLFTVTLIALILLGGVSVYYSNPTTYVYATEEKGDNRAYLAEIIINKVSASINYTLSLAEKYDIEIPENLSKKIDVARDLLFNASSVVDEEPCLAIKLAIKASIVFAPVAKYVYRNLPEDVKMELKESRLECEIKVRLNLVDRLNLLVDKLENMSITVPDRVKDDLATAEDLLNQALDMVKSGNYTVPDVVALMNQANDRIKDAIKVLHGDFKIIWRRASIADISLHLLGKLAFKLEDHINMTIQMIENNETQAAIQHITMMMKVINITLVKLDKFSGCLGNMSDEYQNVVNEIKDTLRRVYNLLNEAKESLENEDTISAVSYLKSAISEIENTLNDLKDEFADAHIYLARLRNFVLFVDMRFKSWVKHMAMYKLASLFMKLGHMEHYLKHAYMKYKAGELSAEDFRNILEHSKVVLRNVLEILENLEHPPHKAIQFINNLLQWIEEIEATLPS